MLYSSRAVALLISTLVCVATVALLTLVEDMPRQGAVVGGVISFASSFLLIYTVFEYMVFSEVRKIYKSLERINKKELKAVRRIVSATPANPLQALDKEIVALAGRKQEEIDELKKIEAYRREFLADISHELKTPLFAAQGFIETLLDGAADDEEVRIRFLRKAAHSLDGMGEMVQELLLLSQLETGVLTMRQDVFDLAQLTTEVVETLEENAASRRIALVQDTPLGKPMWVQGDRSRIRQVLVNLAENAIKYGHEGGAVSVRLEPDRDHVTVHVQDNGPGIEPEHLGRIFERFYRVEKSRSRDMGGSGLGLAIVKQILEAHHSRIQVSSKVGRGTAFHFKLKRKKPAVQTAT